MMEKKKHKSAKPVVLYTEKALYFDVLRIISIILSVYYFAGGRETGTCLATISGMGPVLFLMVSGAALLDQEERWRDVWLRRIVPAFLSVLIFSFLYFLSDVRLSLDKFDLYTFFADFYGDDRIPAFNYCYAYIGFLISLPLLRTLARNMRNREFVYLLVVAFLITAFLPLIDDMYFLRRYTMNYNFRLNWVVNYIILFPFAGYYIHWCLDRDQLKKLTAILWAVAIIWIVVVIRRTINYTTTVEAGAIFHDYEKQCYLPLGMALFATMRLIVPDRSHWSVLAEIAGCGTGVYLMQGFMLGRFEKLEGIRLALVGENSGLRAAPRVLIWSLVVCLLLGLITWALRRIPYVRALFDHS